jgi:hypothetical protein
LITANFNESKSNKDNIKTNGISLIVECPKDSDCIEVLLEYEEIKKVIEELWEDQKTFEYSKFWFMIMKKEELRKLIKETVLEVKNI